MNRVRSVWICLFLLTAWCNNAAAQYNDYRYSRHINGITDTWHSITLPDEIFAKPQHDLPDMRIIFVQQNDTVEAPYLLKVLREQRHENPVSFRRINEARTPEGYQYVLELPEVQDVNEIEVFFNEVNFDRRVRVEFSQYVDRLWAAVPETFRIVSMKNNDVEFQYTRLRFATTKARFFRVTILNVADPKLTEARVTNVTITEGTYRTYAAVDSIFNDK